MKIYLAGLTYDSNALLVGALCVAGVVSLGLLVFLLWTWWTLREHAIHRPGFMTNEGGKPQLWNREFAFPLQVYLDSKLDDVYIQAYEKARTRINDIIGRCVYDKPLVLPLEHDDNCRLMYRSVVMRPTVDKDANGLACIFSSVETGEITSVRIFLPAKQKKYAYKIALHELLHGLGLRHAEHPRSIMYHELQDRTQELMQIDEDLLRKAYGPR